MGFLYRLGSPMGVSHGVTYREGFLGGGSMGGGGYVGRGSGGLGSPMGVSYGISWRGGVSKTSMGSYFGGGSPMRKPHMGRGLLWGLPPRGLI